jgi:hypothetical protein
VAAASSATEGTEGEATGDEETKLSELRSVVAYLRKEKEIVDLQLELSKQETARLKAQIEHLSQSLDETRTTLSEVFAILHCLCYIPLIPYEGTRTSSGNRSFRGSTC